MTKAASIVKQAIKSGMLCRPMDCERCGEAGMILGHHHDYSKPLSVIWLCRPCHAKEHLDVGNSGFKSGFQVRLTCKNEAGLKKLAGKSKGLLTVGKIANFAIAMYLAAKKKPHNP